MITQTGTESELIYRQQVTDTLENDKALLNQIISGMSVNDAQLDHYVAQQRKEIIDYGGLMA